MENAWSDASIDGVSLHWFPKDLNLRKILTSKVKIKRGNWTGPSDSSGTLLLRTPKPPGRASAWSWRSGTEWSHFVTEMHVNASGRIEWNYHSNTYYALPGVKPTNVPDWRLLRTHTHTHTHHRYARQYISTYKHSHDSLTLVSRGHIIHTHNHTHTNIHTFMHVC